MYRILVENGLVIMGLNDHLVVPVVFSAKSDPHDLSSVEVRDPVAEAEFLVKPVMDGKLQGLIPPPDILNGQVDPVSQAAEIGCLGPGVEILVGDLEKRPGPDVPSFHHMNHHINLGRRSFHRNRAHRDKIEEAIAEKPPATINEARHRIEETTGIVRSNTAVYRFLKKTSD